MKYRANDPCHCNSGRKYKKCCMGKDLQEGKSFGPRNLALSPEAIEELLAQQKELRGTAVEVLQRRKESEAASPLTAEELVWEPLKSLPEGRLITREEMPNYTRPSHGRFFKKIEDLARMGTSIAAKEALALLDTVPQREATQLQWYGAARALLLQTLERREDSLLCQLEQALALQDELLWLLWGTRGVQWFQKYPESALRQDILDQLRETCEQYPFVAPRLLLAYGLSTDPQVEEPPEEAVALYKEALLVRAWPWKKTGKRAKKIGKYFQSSQGEWLGVIGDGFHRLLSHLNAQHHRETLLRYTQELHKFPLEQISPKFREITVGMLCGPLEEAGLPRDISRVCESLAPVLAHSPTRVFWQGRAKQMQGEHKDALRFFLKASEHASALTENQRIAMIDFFFGQGQLSAARPVLDVLEQREGHTYLVVEYWYHQLSGKYQEALTYAEQLLALDPEAYDAKVWRFRLLDVLELHEQMSQELLALLSHQDENLRYFAHAYMGIHYTATGRQEEALALFDALPEDLDPEIFLGDKSLQVSFLGCLGDCLERQERWDEAERYYRQAIALKPLVSTYTRLMLYFIRRERFDEAQELLPVAQELAHDDFYVQYVQLQLALHFERGDEAREILERLGQEAFVQRDNLRDWLWSWLRLYLDTDEPTRALRLSEEHLADILEDEELCQIRNSLLEDILTRYQELEARLGEQEALLDRQQSQLQSMEHTRKLLRHKSEESQRRQVELQQALREQSSLRQELKELQHQPPEHTHEGYVSEQLGLFIEQREALLARLMPNSRQLLRNAERLWHKLKTHPDDDHGSVVLQLARIVEGELNTRFIDGLASLACAQKLPFSSLPKPTLGQLKASGNRLSLGDVGKFLYHTLTTQERDGSISLQRNPYSNDTHKQLLADFWLQVDSHQSLPEPVKDYLQGALSAELKHLTHHRNQVSHAGQPMSRQDAKALRELVLGPGPGLGMLEAIAHLPL